MQRLTARDYFGRAYVPGYAPHCADPETARLLVLLTERLADLEDEKESEESN